MYMANASNSLSEATPWPLTCVIIISRTKCGLTFCPVTRKAHRENARDNSGRSVWLAVWSRKDEIMFRFKRLAVFVQPKLQTWINARVKYQIRTRAIHVPGLIIGGVVLN